MYSRLYHQVTDISSEKIKELIFEMDYNFKVSTDKDIIITDTEVWGLNDY